MKFEGIDYDILPNQTYKVPGKFIIEIIEAAIEKNKKIEKLELSSSTKALQIILFNGVSFSSLFDLNNSIKTVECASCSYGKKSQTHGWACSSVYCRNGEGYDFSGISEIKEATT
jgi:hypothetical protein